MHSCVALSFYITGRILICILINNTEKKNIYLLIHTLQPLFELLHIFGLSVPKIVDSELVGNVCEEK